MKRLLLAVALLAAGAGTYAQFQGTLAGLGDQGDTAAHFTANTTKPGQVDPGHAYEDINDDGRFTNDTDEPIPNRELADGTYTVDAPDHGLVVPNSVGSIEPPAGEIHLESGENARLTIDVKLEAPDGVRLSAGTGLTFADAKAETEGAIALDAGVAIDLESTTLESDATIQITAEERVYARSATFEGPGNVTLESSTGDVLANAATIETGSGIAIDAGGHARADGALLAAENDVALTAGGDVYVQRATLETSQQASLEAGASEATIYVQDARFRDADDTAKAGPGGVEIVGEPAEGSIET